MKFEIEQICMTKTDAREHRNVPAAISVRAESGDKISDTIIPKLYLISKCFAEITPKKKPAARFIVIFLDNILEFYSSLRNIFQKRKLLFVSSVCENTVAAYLIFMTLSCGFMIKYAVNSSAAAEMTNAAHGAFEKYVQSRLHHVGKPRNFRQKSRPFPPRTPQKKTAPRDIPAERSDRCVMRRMRNR